MPRQQQLTDDIGELDQREQDIMEKLALYGSGVELFERAERPESPAQPKPIALLGALLGLLGAGIWAWWAAARNQRAEGGGDPARILGAPLLGEVPAPRASPAPAGGPAMLPPAREPGVADAYHVVVADAVEDPRDAGVSRVRQLDVAGRDVEAVRAHAGAPDLLRSARTVPPEATALAGGGVEVLAGPGTPRLRSRFALPAIPS